MFLKSFRKPVSLVSAMVKALPLGNVPGNTQVNEYKYKVESKVDTGPQWEQVA